MSNPKNTKQVLKAIGCDKLQLVAGRGYWYFIYDDVANGLYDTMSVYTTRLSDLPLDEWVRDGREFVAKMEQRNV